jgi:RNA polymerase sigma factor (sigma-70 family)
MSTDASSDVDKLVARESSPQDDSEFRGKIERLFRQQNPALLGILYVRLRDKESARDVAQEAYERVFTREKEETRSVLAAATVGHLRNYLFKTALHIAANRQRNSRVRNGHLALLRAQGEAPSAEEQCIQQQEWARLRRALDELPQQCRIAFTLVEVECRAPADVAVQMGIKRNTVYQLVRRAYEHLMRALSAEDRGGRP